MRNHVLSGGVNVRPSDRLALGVQLAYVSSAASIDPFDLSRPEYTERFPLIALDFSQTHTYSDIDTDNTEARVDARLRVSDRVWVQGLYRWVDYNDDAPLLYDTSGRNQIFAISLRYGF